MLEVLVSILITGIGLLALLSLFPLGALSMAQAINDDRESQLHDAAHALNEAAFRIENVVNLAGVTYRDWLQRAGADSKELFTLRAILEVEQNQLWKMESEIRSRSPDLSERDRQLAGDVICLLQQARHLIAALQRNLMLIQNIQQALLFPKGEVNS